LSGAHMLVRGIGHRAARVSRDDVLDPFQIVEDGFQAPEAPTGQRGDVLAHLSVRPPLVFLRSMISDSSRPARGRRREYAGTYGPDTRRSHGTLRSEERRVGKGGRSQWQRDSA